MKNICLAFVVFLFPLSVFSQDFIDMFKLAANTTELGNVDNDFETGVDNYLAELYYPTLLSGNTVLLAGFTLEKTRLGLTEEIARTNLGMTRLNLGIKQPHSEKWTGTYVLLPKLASDFENIGSDDFQFGALALLDYQKSEEWNWKFGVYSSSENFGTTITPIVGFWHRSKDEKFYVNATLPIRGDVNYSIGNNFSIGGDLLTSIKSYNLSGFEDESYVQEESIRMAAYLAYGILNDKFILRGRAGLDTTDYGLYAQGDTVGAQVLTFQLGGDDRNRLNSEYEAAPYFGVDLIYRINLRMPSM